MYFSSWYTACFHSGTVREFTYLILMVPGYVFFRTLLRVDPVPREYPYGVGMWITAAEVVGDAFFGIAVIADQTMHRGRALPRGRKPTRSARTWPPARSSAAASSGSSVTPSGCRSSPSS